MRHPARESSVMKAGMSKASLSPSRRWFVELLQEINFGRVEGLALRDGQPLRDPPPQVVHEVKFGGENGPRPERLADDFVLKAQVIDLFQHFDRICTGTIDLLDVKHGLPFRMLVTAGPG